MKTISVIIFNLLTLGGLYGQIEIPFYEPFEDETFLDRGITMSSLTDPLCPLGATQHENCNPDPSLPLCSIENIIERARNYSWSISNDFQRNSLKLTVHPEDHPQCATGWKSRTEISYSIPTPYQQKVYYSWRFFIPNDTSFDEEIPTNNGPSWYAINQFLYPSNDGDDGGKQLSINYVPDENAVTNKRDLYIRMYGSVGPINDVYSEVYITDGLEKGVWNEIIWEVTWSEHEFTSFNSDPGKYRLWINRSPVVTDQTVNYPDRIRYNASVGNFLEPNGVFYCPTIRIKKQQPILSNGVIKFGHYRGGHTTVNTAYIDDFRMTYDFPPVEGETHVLSMYCDAVLEAQNELKLEAYEVQGATDYKFRFSQNGTPVYYLNTQSPKPEVSLKWVNGGETYEVDVKAKVNGIYSSYGKVCSVTLSDETKVIEESCEQTITTADPLQCYLVGNASNYKFWLTNLSTGEAYYLNSNSANNWVGLQGILPGNYNVRVRAQGTDFDFNYGEGCIVTINPGFSSKGKSINNNGTFHSDVRLVPNPAVNAFHFNTDTSINDLKIFNIDSQKVVLEKRQVHGYEEIMISSLDKGVYIVVFSIDDTQYVSKLLKTN